MANKSSTTNDAWRAKMVDTKDNISRVNTVGSTYLSKYMHACAEWLSKGLFSSLWRGWSTGVVQKGLIGIF